MKRSIKVFVSFILTLVLVVSCIPLSVHAGKYSKYSNSTVEFGLNLRTDHKKPSCNKPKGVKKISKYDTYYYDTKAYKKKDKVIYLTFDCGYENGNTKKILKTLKKNKIKAIFFVTERYIKKNTKLVKRMKKEGHLVGNHTCNHLRMTKLSVKKMKKEVTQCAKTMKKKTGYDMDPYFRPPEGVYSVRVMKVMQDLGYHTILWSLALYDYDEKDQPGADYVVKKFKKHHFCGMIPLLHVISSSDRKALPRVISTMKKKGYRFGSLDEFATHKSEEKKKDKDKKTTETPKAKSQKTTEAAEENNEKTTVASEENSEKTTETSDNKK